jgi:lysophospholipase L1-like esterase
VRAPLLVLSVIVALVAGEGLLRAVGFSARLAKPSDTTWPWVVYDPIVGRANRPGLALAGVPIGINSLGFRGEEISRRKRPGTLRVACLGDSATFGVWKAGVDVLITTSYPAELRRLLADAGRRDVEVINAGVLGHTTGHGLAELLARVLPLAPDVVTVRYGNNDHVIRRNLDVPPAAHVWDYAALRLLPAPTFELETVRLGFAAYRRALALRRPPPGPLVPIDAFGRNLHRFVRIAHARGVNLLFIDFPYRPVEQGPSPGETYPNWYTDARSLAEFHALHDGYQAVVGSVARETGTPLLETAEAFRRSPTPVFTPDDMSHPNEAGLELLARLLFARLLDLGWLDAEQQR